MESPWMKGVLIAFAIIGALTVLAILGPRRRGRAWWHDGHDAVVRRHDGGLPEHDGDDDDAMTERRRPSPGRLPLCALTAAAMPRYGSASLSKVQAEWKLVCPALNLRRMGGLCAA